MALLDVQARLAERFPDLDAAVVEAAVRVAYTGLQGPIRDYVPVLVEHAARERLRALARERPHADLRDPMTMGSAGMSTSVSAAEFPGERGFDRTQTLL